MRLLTHHVPLQTFAQLGMIAAQCTAVERLLQGSQGFIVVTGPTGSGKTTTLYSMLQYLGDGSRNIMTLEDPIEYTIPGICQGHVQEQLGCTFAQGMKALVRHDPDVLMIGEIRDPASARAALQAAMTGHLVLTSMHTADTTSALIRLLDMGIEPYLLTAALTAVIAQRLVPACCCHVQQIDNLCSCQGTGVSGQTGIFELLTLSPQLRTFIGSSPEYQLLRKQSRDEGLYTLQDDLAYKVKQGIVSPQALYAFSPQDF